VTVALIIVAFVIGLFVGILIMDHQVNKLADSHCKKLGHLSGRMDAKLGIVCLVTDRQEKPL
jgi:uncharacterized membrane-anchored protein YhcB (DUF1043 family)